MSIRFILVATSHPGNIGAAARAMKAMGQSELWLVAPLSFPHPDATARAAGADDVLAAARVVPTLAEAVADCGLVLGTSARPRSEYYWPSLAPREALPGIADAARDGHVALLFGTERVGLTNQELALCQALIHIPVQPGFESLNVAQAVQILAYEIHCAAGTPLPVARRRSPLAPAAELERLLGHLAEVLADVGFQDRRGGAHLLRRFRQLAGRAGLDQDEVRMLRGFLAAVQTRRRRAGSAR